MRSRGVHGVQGGLSRTSTAVDASRGDGGVRGGISRARGVSRGDLGGANNEARSRARARDAVDVEMRASLASMSG